MVTGSGLSSIGSGGSGGPGGPGGPGTGTPIRGRSNHPQDTVESFSYIVNRNGCYFIVSGDGKKLSDCFESHAAADKARKEMLGSGGPAENKNQNRGK